MQAWKRYDYDTYVGGIITMSKEMFESINGCVTVARRGRVDGSVLTVLWRRACRYPNNFWGWGGEDDELGRRMHELRIVPYRPPKEYDGGITDLEEEMQAKLGASHHAAVSLRRGCRCIWGAVGCGQPWERAL
jgi:hypothetical protein